jgi:hypothetical protein
MSSSLQISDLLKVAKDIPILHTGINETAMEYSTYPVKEHPKLLSSLGKPASTPLNSMLAMRIIKIPTDRNDPNYKDRALLETYKKNALTLTFRGTRTAPVSVIEWEEFYLHLVPLVVEHPKILLSVSKNLTNSMTKLYRASNDFIGDASLTVEQRSTLKLKSLCLPLLADDPWTPGAQEDDEVDKIVLEELALAAIPTDADEKRKFDNTVVLYKSALTLLRELLNHTFLRAVYHTSSRQAQNEYKEIQRTFVSKNSVSRHATVFTAVDIIDYIKKNCTCDNSKAIIQMKNSIAAIIRYKGQNLVSWFQTFQPLVNKYKKAIGLTTTLDDNDLKALWKEHFSKQITVAERTVMKTFQASHLAPTDVTKIKKLSDGIFDDTVLYRLLALLATSFEPYNPDNTVMAYLKQHAQALRWEQKLDFRPPREKEKEQDKSNDKGEIQSQKRKNKSSRKPDHKTDRKSSSSKRVRMTDKRVPNPKRTKSGDHCRRQRCRDRGTNVNHTHDDCKFKESDTLKKTESDRKHHPNLGRAPGKKPRNTKTTPSRPEKNANTSQFKEAGERRCYICNQPDHLANACPSKGKIKAGAQKSLYKNKSFMALWQSSFADKEQQQCATRLLKSWGDDLCPTCMGELSFDHRCDTNDIAIAKHTKTVRDVLRTTPLLDTIRSAHEYQRESTEKPEPINMGPDFFLDAGGQDESDNELASADTESQRSTSESEDNNEEQDHSERSGDDSSPGDDSSNPPSPSEDEREDWE